MSAGSATNQPMPSAIIAAVVPRGNATACQPCAAPRKASGAPIAPSAAASTSRPCRKRKLWRRVSANAAQIATIHTGAACGDGTAEAYATRSLAASAESSAMPSSTAAGISHASMRPSGRLRYQAANGTSASGASHQ